jgi:DNA-binding LytR/AlgR family response regulator
MSKEAAVLNCMIVEDEPLALALLTDYIGKMPRLKLCLATSDPLEGLPTATSGNIDLVFLDMQMPELNGLQFMKILQKRSMVIVTTAYSEYALEGYEHHVVDYLLKPVTFDRFIMAVEKALERRHPVPAGSAATKNDAAPLPSYIFVKTDYRMVKVFLADILYLEGARDYVVIHTTGGQLLTLQSLKSLEEMLPASNFLRVHRSYVVALDKINFVERNRVSVAKELIPVSDTFKDNLYAHIKA